MKFKALLNGKFDEFSQKLASIEENFDKTTKEIYLKLDKIEKDTEESRIKSSKNSDEIEGLKFQISDQNEQIIRQNEAISELESEIEELKNRSVRKTLIFKNIKHQVNENSWSDTKNVLIYEMSKVLTEASKEKTVTNIERAHRVQSNSETRNRSNNTPPYLVAKIANWEFSERIKSAFIVENQNGNSRVFVSQMYSKSLTLRRNQALKHRYKLKEGDPSIQGYVRYPATLMIKRAGERKYRVEKEY